MFLYKIRRNIIIHFGLHIWKFDHTKVSLSFSAVHKTTAILIFSCRRKHSLFSYSLFQFAAWCHPVRHVTQNAVYRIRPQTLDNGAWVINAIKNDIGSSLYWWFFVEFSLTKHLSLQWCFFISIIQESCLVQFNCKIINPLFR